MKLHQPSPCFLLLSPEAHSGQKAELTKIAGYIPRRLTCPRAVTYLSSNRAHCRLITLIEPNARTLPVSRQAVCQNVSERT